MLELFVAEGIGPREVADVHDVGFEELADRLPRIALDDVRGDRPVFDGGEAVRDEALAAQFDIDGAHGRLIAGRERMATSSERAPEQWLANVERDQHGFVSMTSLTREEQADEALLMGLRLEEGLDLKRLEEIGGLRPNAAVIGELAEAGQITVFDRGRRIRATESGRMVLNTLVLRLSSAFVPVDAGLSAEIDRAGSPHP